MTKEIDSDEISFANLSAVDDVGDVFLWRGRLFRGINYSYGDKIKALLSSDMVSKLIDCDMFPNSWISDNKLHDYELLVEHEKILNVTYPYEWTFSMLKDAALLVLNINSITQEFNFQTKDCHVFYDLLFLNIVQSPWVQVHDLA